jgi:pimeloyl-ACP methyl ester carboxylesterase
VHFGTVDHVVTRGGCSLHYSVTGRGPVVLFIQGVGVHGSGWRPQVDALAADFTCITFDNRGVGRSQPVGDPISVTGMADDACAILDGQDVGAAHVVGHSLGGLVALQVALAHRARVRSLSLLCTFASGRAAAPLTPRMLWLGTRARVGTRRMRRRGFLRLVLPPGVVAGPDAIAAELADLFGHDLADQEPVTGAQLAAMRASDLTARLGELACLPALVVSATHDPIAPPAAGRTIAAGIPGARFVQVADASHGLPITHAGTVNDLLRGHVRER